MFNLVDWDAFWIAGWVELVELEQLDNCEFAERTAVGVGGPVLDASEAEEVAAAGWLGLITYVLHADAAHLLKLLQCLLESVAARWLALQLLLYKCSRVEKSRWRTLVLFESAP